MHGQKLTQKFTILTSMYRQSGQLIFRSCGPLGRCQEGYLPALRLYKEHAHKLEYERLLCYRIYSNRSCTPNSSHPQIVAAPGAQRKK